MTASRPSAWRVARPVAWLVVAALAAACAPRVPPPIGAGGRPFEPDADERALWAQAEREERALLEHAPPYDDPLLDEYLASVGQRLLPAGLRAAGGPALTFGVIRDPTLNAFAMPDGRIYVHTGLLSRLDSEGQLAAILAREMTHVVDRDALRVARGGRNARGLRTVVRPTTLSPTAGAVLGLGLQLAALASIDGYGADCERDADAGTLARLVAAGYDPREAPAALERLLAGVEGRGALETFLLGRPAWLRERIDATARLLPAASAPAAARAPMASTEQFGQRMRPVVRENAVLDARAGRFELARAQLDRVLAVTPGDPVAHLYAGDLDRLQAQRARAPEDRAELRRRARESYQRSATLDPAAAAPYRQLGLLSYEEGDVAQARAAFERYLALAPDARDAERIREYLMELDR